MNHSELNELENELIRAGWKLSTKRPVYEQWRAPNNPAAILIERYTNAAYVWQSDRRSPRAVIDEIRATKEATDNSEF